jgi:hypothetical protein
MPAMPIMRPASLLNREPNFETGFADTRGSGRFFAADWLRISARFADFSSISGFGGFLSFSLFGFFGFFGRTISSACRELGVRRPLRGAVGLRR